MSDSSAEQTIFRRRRGNPYTTISNAPLRDRRLSLEARGFLVSVMSLPEDWVFNRAWARNEYGVGRDKLDRIIRELKEADYVRFVQSRDRGGRMAKSAYVFTADAGQFDENEPLPENPYSGGPPLPEKPFTAAPSPANTDTYKEKKLTKDIHLQSAPTGADRNFSPEEVSPPPAPRPTPAAVPAATVDWRNRLIQYRRRAIWPPKWGPPMHAPGCLVPPDLVREWDATSGKAFTEEEQKPAWQGRKKRDWQAASSAIN